MTSDPSNENSGASRRRLSCKTIDPETNLRVCSENRASLQAFASRFRQFWDRLRPEHKRTMVDYWLNPAHGMADDGPSIWMVEDWPGRVISSAATMQPARDTPEFRILVHQDSFESMSDEAAVELFAHELAHVHQLATGTLHDKGTITREEAIRLFEEDMGEPFDATRKWVSPETIEDALEEFMYENSNVEREAHAIMESWGFDGTSLEEWNKQRTAELLNRERAEREPSEAPPSSQGDADRT